MQRQPKLVKHFENEKTEKLVTENFSNKNKYGISCRGYRFKGITARWITCRKCKNRFRKELLIFIEH